MAITKSNYDQSSTGVNIEVTVMMDTDISRIYFEENFHLYSYSGHASTCRAWFTDYGQREAPDTVADCIDWQAATPESARDWLHDYLDDGPADILATVNEYHDGDWIEAARETVNGGWRGSWDDGIDLADAISNDFASVSQYFTIRYNVVAIRGYCQGDYAEVLYDPAIWSSDFDPRSYFRQLFYDCPVYARVDIDGADYYLDEGMGDRYTWDRAEAEKIVRSWDIAESTADQVVAMLPDTPEYP